MSTILKHEALRKCRRCGLEAFNEEDLKLFKKEIRRPYGRGTICKKCEVVVVRSRSIGSKHRQSRLKYQNEWTKRLYATNRELAILKLSNSEPKCIICGYSTDLRALVIDHINNDGKKERKQFQRLMTYRRILNSPLEEIKKDYQILCRNCNWIRQMDILEEQTCQ